MKRWATAKPLTEKPISNYFVKDGLYLQLQKFKISDTLPPISEDESIILYVTDGEGKITINGAVFPLSYGSFAWLQSYHTYTIEPVFGGTLEFSVCIYDYPLSSYLIVKPQTQKTASAIMTALPVIGLNETERTLIERLLTEFENENCSRSIGSTMIRVSILGQIVTSFISSCIKRAQSEQRPPLPLSWHLILYIAENYRGNLTLEDVAKNFDCDGRTANRELRRASGLDFAQTLLRVRINVSCGALLFEDVSLSYLLSYSGFSTEASFYRAFKKQKGMSPNEYRAASKNRNAHGHYGMIGSKLVMYAMNYINLNYHTPLTQKQIANELFTSDININDKFKKMFGMTLKHIILLNRIRHAESLLVTTDLPLLDVAIAVGFNSTKVFTRAFKKINSIGPSEFRRQRSEEAISLFLSPDEMSKKCFFDN